MSEQESVASQPNSPAFPLPLQVTPTAIPQSIVDRLRDLSSELTIFVDELGKDWSSEPHPQASITHRGHIPSINRAPRPKRQNSVARGANTNFHRSRKLAPAKPTGHRQVVVQNRPMAQPQPLCNLVRQMQHVSLSPARPCQPICYQNMGPFNTHNVAYGPTFPGASWGHWGRANPTVPYPQNVTGMPPQPPSFRRPRSRSAKRGARQSAATTQRFSRTNSQNRNENPRQKYRSPPPRKRGGHFGNHFSRNQNARW